LNDTWTLFPSPDINAVAGQNRISESVSKASFMRRTAITLLVIVAASAILAQQQTGSTHIGAGATTLNLSPNLPVEPIGRNDLIGITVYDSPELTRTVRVDDQGEIRLPMLVKPIQAAGLYPADLESAIKAALIDEQVLVVPIVTVSVVEYRSRPITVVGAVRSPATFQATGTVTLLDAISQVGGLTENAGSEILVSRPQLATEEKPTNLIQRIPVRGLFDTADPSLNLILHGGEEIRVPEAGRFFILGNVKHPGAFFITDGSESSILKALALSEGLNRYTAHIAYIYRTEGGSGGRNEIPVELKKIMDRKSPDVSLMANDILYIPEANGRRETLTALNQALLIGAGLSATLIYLYH
jgi:polysaccharide export outer membrane protein